MNNPHQHLAALHDIRSMMEKSSRFVSLSGLSGVAAGICALAGAIIAQPYVTGAKNYVFGEVEAITGSSSFLYYILHTWLFWIAAGTFIAAFISSFLFTWLKNRKNGTPIWNRPVQRMLISFAVPLVSGGLFLFKLMEHYGSYGIIAPGCLIFYGLALLNTSKYTLNEIRYLGYGQLVLGIINLGFTGAGLYFWALGFGVLHIVYGTIMWYKYDRTAKTSEA